MLIKIQRTLEKELKSYCRNLDKISSLINISPLLSRNIKGYILRKGKRLRPVLFVIGYLGFKKKAASNLYKSALSFELLHDFLLVHDDIIDKSATRRGKPSMHEIFNKYLTRRKNIKFSGQDLSLVAGDIMYALAMQAFLSIEEDARPKEEALKKFIEAAIHTGAGEFIELLYGTKSMDRITCGDIYKIYDLKTACYTFSSPLATGATLAGAKHAQVNALFKFGIYIGRAFQIKDDIIGMFKEEKEIGKSNLTDLQEAKKTILIWYAYRHCDKITKALIKKILSKKNVGKTDLLKMREIVTESGALDYAKEEISRFTKNARALLFSSKMFAPYKELLLEYSDKILGL